MSQNAPQPGEPFAAGGALKALEVAMRFVERLLHEVRSIDLGPQPAFDLRVSDTPQIIAAGGKELLAAGSISLPCAVHQVIESGRILDGHPSCPDFTVYEKSFARASLLFRVA